MNIHCSRKRFLEIKNTVAKLKINRSFGRQTSPSKWEKKSEIRREKCKEIGPFYQNLSSNKGVPERQNIEERRGNNQGKKYKKISQNRNTQVSRSEESTGDPVN